MQDVDHTTLQLHLVYRQAEVVSGQRLRFLHSSRLKQIGFLGLFAIAFFTAQQLSPNVPHPPGGPNWAEPLVVAAVFLLVPAVIYLVAPILDFRLNRGWRGSYILHLSADGLALDTEDGSTAFAAPWQRVSRMLENGDVVIIFFGGEKSFVILPKRIFAAAEGLQRLRTLLPQHVSSSQAPRDGNGTRTSADER